MDNWNEIRTAAQVARLGTISAAANALGVHRATINRHIDMLEAELGGKLFQRHPRGFTPTELGHELLRIADATDEQFSQLQRFATKQSDELTGDFVVTSLDILADAIMPLLAEFRRQHPQVTTRFLASHALVKLEYGQAHVAFRAGPKPQDPDNVVQAFSKFEVGLYAAKTYVQAYGMPRSIDEFADHQFVGPSDKKPRSPALKWLVQHVPEHAIAFTCNHMPILNNAVLAGIGIGFLTKGKAELNEDLIEVMPPRPEWCNITWIVTHVDLHRSPKVQSFMKIIKVHHQKNNGSI